jgi:hypothetical protein
MGHDVIVWYTHTMGNGQITVVSISSFSSFVVGAFEALPSHYS